MSRNIWIATVTFRVICIFCNHISIMSSSSRMVNQRLYFELQDAIEQDKLYWIKNEAKIKAALTSKSYDEFRGLVDAAHLKALTKKDKERKQRSWQTLTDYE